jgi:hypothetical protein
MENFELQKGELFLNKEKIGDIQSYEFKVENKHNKVINNGKIYTGVREYSFSIQFKQTSRFKKLLKKLFKW